MNVHLIFLTRFHYMLIITSICSESVDLAVADCISLFTIPLFFYKFLSFPLFLWYFFYYLQNLECIICDAIFQTSCCVAPTVLCRSPGGYFLSSAGLPRALLWWFWLWFSTAPIPNQTVSTLLLFVMFCWLFVKFYQQTYLLIEKISQRVLFNF